MAQVTQDMCEHIMAANDRGEMFPLTINEQRQLAYIAAKCMQLNMNNTDMAGEILTLRSRLGSRGLTYPQNFGGSAKPQ